MNEMSCPKCGSDKIQFDCNVELASDGSFCLVNAVCCFCDAALEAQYNFVSFEIVEEEN